MRKKIKNTITFFSLFIGLVIFSHSIVPHDHHLSIFDIYNTHNENNPDKGFAHCFYLNNVVIQKSFTHFNIAKKKPVKAKIFTVKSIAKKEVVFFINNINDDNLYHPVNTILSYSSPTRGSPFLIV